MAHEVSQPPLKVFEVAEGVLVAQFDVGKLGLVGTSGVEQLDELVDRAEADPAVRAVIVTGSHPERFIAHADVAWLQEGGEKIPPLTRGIAGALAKTARLAGRNRVLRTISRRTPLWGAVQLDSLHRMLVKMNTSGVVYIAAMNGSALGLGAEIAWACDVRLMADGDFFIGHPEVLLGFAPAAGGTQRLSRLVGEHRALLTMLEGQALSVAQALEFGAIDEVVAKDDLQTRALARAQHFGKRRKEAVRAIKRAVYLGSSDSLEAGMHAERVETLHSLPQRQAQELMVAYLEDTTDNGELLLYRPDDYAAAVARGTVPVADTATRKDR